MTTETNQRFGFGTTLASDYVPDEAGQDTVWIRGFRDGSTQIRIAPAEGVNAKGEHVFGPEAWPSEREHYDRGARLSYPCPREHGADSCPGCSSDVEQVRRRTRTYYVNALDKDGRMRVYKFGITVYKILLGRHERLVAADPANQQPLSDRDIIVTRMGKEFNDISYDVDWGEKYAINWEETEPLDINKALEDSFVEALQKYEGGESLRQDDSVPADTNPNPNGSFTAADAVAKGKAPDDTTGAAAKNGRIPGADKAADEAEDEETEEALPNLPSEEQLDGAETIELRRWLKEVAHVEFPERAPRARLLKLAKAALPQF